MEKQKATFKGEHQTNASNYGGEKEMTEAWSVLTISKGKIVELITCRCWMGRSKSASVRYASIWIHPKTGDWTTGTGKAGGYGYCKKSAAVGAAIASAGVELRESISGVGDRAIRDAFIAIGRMLGYRGEITVIEH